jgi:hypothetical protein
MSSKMSMVFSKNGSNNRSNMGRVSMNVALHSPQHMIARNVVGMGTTAGARSAPRGIRQLFNLGDIMSNPGAPCKACGS